MELSKRLAAVAGAVTSGNRVADIGTDHGYVPIYLIHQGICPSALAMDVNKGPLERARAHIHSEGLDDKIETRLSDGLKQLTPSEVDTVVVAGMGGDLICRILTAAPTFLKQGIEFILQPQSEWFKVRHYLHEHGYAIRKEWFLEEDGKYYVVLHTVPASEKDMSAYPSEFDYQYGYLLLQERHPVLLSYLQREMHKKEAIVSGMEADADQNTDIRAGENAESSGRDKREERCRQLRRDIEQIKNYLNTTGNL